jgi:adenosylcobyric acid synthase
VVLRGAGGVPAVALAGGGEVRGYELHCGRVDVAPGARPLGTLPERRGAAEGCVAGSVAGTLVHGLFESAAVRRALCAGLGAPVGAEPPGDPYDRLADHVARALDLRLLDGLVGL